MAPRKQYADPAYYENKLNKVMERMGVGEEYNYDFNRHSSWIEFTYKGQLYRFDHSVKKAQDNGQKLNYGSDCFAQIVLALEDLARIIERGIYDLSTWVAGMKHLPAPETLPDVFRVLGFDTVPRTTQEIEAKYRKLSKIYHPDVGGDPGEFEKIKLATEQAKKHVEASQ